MSTIAIYDSGVGGLSIYKEVKKELPQCGYIFISDNLAYPYGEKSEDELNKRVVNVVHQVMARFSPDLMVVACNTASTVVLPLLRSKYDLPIVGVVPAIKPAGQLSKTRKIGLLATRGTIKRKYTDKLIKEFAVDCEFTKIGSHLLVEQAERKIYGKPVDMDLIEAELQPFLMQGDMDVLILACTHFPLLNKEIGEIFKVNNRIIKIIDSGKGIANRVASIINRDNKANEQQVAEQDSVAVFTKQIKNETVLLSKLTELGFQQQTLLSI